MVWGEHTGAARVVPRGPGNETMPPVPVFRSSTDHDRIIPMAHPAALTSQPVPSSATRWTSYIMSAIPVGLMIFSGIMKLHPSPAVVQFASTHLGWPENMFPWLSVLELGSVIIYLIPRTAVVGAILITGYLGGAIATHLRVGDAPIVQPLLIALAWGGLFLRDVRLR